MALSGVLNGSDVFLRVKVADGRWLTIGGQTSHTESKSIAAIDITCKQSGGFRELMEGEGLKTLDVSSELVFSTDEAFDYVKNSLLNGSINTYQAVRGAISGTGSTVDEFSAMITSFVETSPDRDKVTANVTFVSSGAWLDGLSFSQFLTVGGDTFKTSNGELFLVRN